MAAASWSGPTCYIGVDYGIAEVPGYRSLVNLVWRGGCE